MLYVENSTDSTQKQLKLIDEFSKGEGYKIDIQKSVIFFILTIKYQKGKEKKIPFKIASKNKIGINLIREVKDLF